MMQRGFERYLVFLKGWTNTRTYSGIQVTMAAKRIKNTRKGISK